jgi:hypothetical protein
MDLSFLRIKPQFFVDHKFLWFRNFHKLLFFKYFSSWHANCNTDTRRKLFET